MARDLKQFLIFIGSPGGLEAERRLFKERIERFNHRHGEPRGITFKAIGWEDTLPGTGQRPQETINGELRECDYAVFVFHDRWGSVAGPSGKVGTEEEWDIAQEMYASRKLLNACLFFKSAAPRYDMDPAKAAEQVMQYQQVTTFRDGIIAAKKHLFKDFAEVPDFGEVLEDLLADWGRTHDGAQGAGPALSDGVVDNGGAVSTAVVGPSFDYWLAESRKLLDEKGTNFNPHGALLFAERAVALVPVASVDWARAENALGNAHWRLGEQAAALASYEEIVRRLTKNRDAAACERVAAALINKSFALAGMKREAEAIAACDEVMKRFGDAIDPKLRKRVAMALHNKGILLGMMKRGAEAVATFDESIRQFENINDADIKEQLEAARRGRIWADKVRIEVEK